MNQLYINALHAIIARIDGVHNHPALEPYLCSDDHDNDVKDIAQSALREIDYKKVTLKGLLQEMIDSYKSKEGISDLSALRDVVTDLLHIAKERLGNDKPMKELYQDICVGGYDVYNEETNIPNRE